MNPETTEHFTEIIKFAKDLLKASVMEGNLQMLFDSLTPEFQEKIPISELGRRLALMEQEHGMFTRIGDATEPYQNQSAPGFFEFDVKMYINTQEWFAHLSINNEHKLNDFNFSREPFYIAPQYFNPHKLSTTQLSELPLIKYIQPNKRHTVKLPIIIFIHAAVQLNIDGKMGVRYPFRDFDYIAQKKVGLIRCSYENYGDPDPIIAITNHCFEKVSNIPEKGNVYLMLHGFAALFLPKIYEQHKTEMDGVILLNPAWEAVPGSNLANMTVEKVPKDINAYIVGSGNDQIMIKDHFDMWVSAFPNCENAFYEKCDHFLMNCETIPNETDYVKKDDHVNNRALKNISTWVKEHSPSE